MKQNKGKKRKLLYRVILIILLSVMIFSLYKICTILMEYRQGTQVYEKIQHLAVREKESENPIDFKALRKENPDIKGWLRAEGTAINYPVVQGKDNRYYLYRMADKSENGKGSLFIDYRCERPFEQFNTIIYGHRMKDGSMFHTLTEYESKEFYEKHRVMEVFLPEKQYKLEIFAAVRIPADSPLYKWEFSGRAEKEKYLSEIEEKNMLETDIKPEPDDRIVMMSTCTYEFEDTRLVVYGRLKG